MSTGDVAWVLAERRFNEDVLAASHWSPEQMLLEKPELRLSGKTVGQVASMSLEWRDGLPGEWLGAPEPELPTPLTEERLWTALGHVLDDDVASLRAPIIPFRDLLWIHVAQAFDRKVWHETSMTADAMLSSPDYGLTRKIVADSTTLSILIDCIPEHGGVGPA